MVNDALLLPASVPASVVLSGMLLWLFAIVAMFGLIPMVRRKRSKSESEEDEDDVLGMEAEFRARAEETKSPIQQENSRPQPPPPPPPPPKWLPEATSPLPPSAPLSPLPIPVPTQKEPAVAGTGLAILQQFLSALEPPPASHTDAVQLLRRVRRALQPRFPEASVQAFGSAMNGLGDAQCDVDIDVSFPGQNDVGRRDRQQRAQKLLLAMSDALAGAGFTIQNIVLSAKVPVCTLSDKDTRRCVDITVNNVLPLYNTRLLRYYAKMYPDGLVTKMVLLVKYWAKIRGVTGAKENHLSSYALTLMVIYYLQVCPSRPVLPSLQQVANQIGEGIRSYTCDEKTYDVSMISATTCLKYWTPPDVMPDLDELLRGFFDYYANTFNYAEDFISIRLGVMSNRSETLFREHVRSHLNGCLWIEDPIETGRNLNCVLTESTLKVLQSELRIAASVLRGRATTLAQLVPLPASRRQLKFEEKKERAERDRREQKDYATTWKSQPTARERNRDMWPGSSPSAYESWSNQGGVQPIRHDGKQEQWWGVPGARLHHGGVYPGDDEWWGDGFQQGPAPVGYGVPQGRRSSANTQSSPSTSNFSITPPQRTSPPLGPSAPPQLGHQRGPPGPGRFGPQVSAVKPITPLKTFPRQHPQARPRGAGKGGHIPGTWSGQNGPGQNDWAYAPQFVEAKPAIVRALT